MIQARTRRPALYRTHSWLQKKAAGLSRRRLFIQLG